MQCLMGTDSSASSQIQSLLVTGTLWSVGFLLLLLLSQLQPPHGLTADQKLFVCAEM